MLCRKFLIRKLYVLFWEATKVEESWFKNRKKTTYCIENLSICDCKYETWFFFNPWKLGSFVRWHIETLEKGSPNFMQEKKFVFAWRMWLFFFFLLLFIGSSVARQVLANTCNVARRTRWHHHGGKRGGWLEKKNQHYVRIWKVGTKTELEQISKRKWI